MVTCSLQLVHCLCCEFCALSAASQCTASHMTIKREEGVNWQGALKQKRCKIRTSHIVLKISVVHTSVVLFDVLGEISNFWRQNL